MKDERKHNIEGKKTYQKPSVEKKALDEVRANVLSASSCGSGSVVTPGCGGYPG